MRALDVTHAGARILRIVVGAAALTIAAACTTDSTSESDGSREPTASESLSELSTFADIEELHRAILDAGYTCELEYEGLEDDDRVVSLCVLRGEQVLLTIWTTPSVLDEFLASGTAGDRVAHGANWTIDTETPETAAEVADALEGRTPD